MRYRLTISFAFTYFALSLIRAVAQEQTWSSLATGQSLKMAVLKPDGFNSNQPTPLIVYVENLAAPRIGTDSDEAIIHDFLKNGNLVITLDYAHHAEARVPFINRDFAALRDQVLHKTFLPGIQIDP